MLSQLTRILLALVTAFVFTGQMEAAAKHCARLANEAALASHADDAPPCHETAEAAVQMHHPAPHHQSTTPEPSDACECIAALKVCAEVSRAEYASRIAPYEWLSEGEMHFASSEPEPDWRPPRA